jgi:hypothetical protein
VENKRQEIKENQNKKYTIMKHNGKARESGGVQGEREVEVGYTRIILNFMLLCSTQFIGTLFISCLDLTALSVFGTPNPKILCPLLLLLILKLDLGALSSSVNVFFRTASAIHFQYLLVIFPTSTSYLTFGLPWFFLSSGLQKTNCRRRKRGGTVSHGPRAPLVLSNIEPSHWTVRIITDDRH